MNRMKKFAASSLLLAGFCFILFSFAKPPQETKAWDIPAKYVSMKNAVASDAASIKAGKVLYEKHCKACPGANGNGDTPKAKGLKMFIGDFTKGFGKQSKDGEIYYKSFVGRDKMPNFEKKITVENERWHIVNYMKSLKTK